MIEGGSFWLANIFAAFSINIEDHRHQKRASQASTVDMTTQLTRILAVDDEADMRETFRSILAKSYSTLTAASGDAALAIIKEEAVAVVLLDIRMPGQNGLEVLKEIKRLEPELDVIMVSASKDVGLAVEAMKNGALDFISKPFEVKELLVVIEKALEKRALVKENHYLKVALQSACQYCDLIGQTPVMKNLFATIERVAATESTVMIQGESGTGKELVAQALHRQSQRHPQPFIAVNCAAIPESLLESELFGYERGSFTGAQERKLGKFELADGGTLFLDEIGCMPAAMQAKLLRVLEDRVVERLGGTKGQPVDVRIISATNIDFVQELAVGRFRTDLYYRLNVIPIKLPPLRERKADLPLFLDYFRQKYNRELKRNVATFAPAVLERLHNYDWPGNVRELQNFVERAIVLSCGEEIAKVDLPTINNQPLNLKQALEDHERRLLIKALSDHRDNHALAAKSLGIPRTSFNSRLLALGLA